MTWPDVDFYDPEEDEKYISASRIKKFNKCPMQYYLSYVEERPDMKLSKGYMELGTAIHESIEVALDSDLDNTSSRFPDKLKSEYHDRKEDVHDKHFADGVEYLNTAAKFINKVDPQVVAIEQEMDYGLSDIGRRFYGFADVVTEDGIVDWKSGNMYSSGKKGDQQVLDNKIQGAVYMGGYLYLYDEPPESVIFVYIKDGKIRKITPDDSTWSEMLSHATDLSEAMKELDSADNFPAKPGDKCFWCPVESWCSASEHSVQNFGHEDIPL